MALAIRWSLLAPVEAFLGFLGFVEANSEAIATLADLTGLLTFVTGVVLGTLRFFGIGPFRPGQVPVPAPSDNANEPSARTEDSAAAAERLLAGLPLDRVPEPGGVPAGSRRPPMPPNRLLVGRDEDLKDLAARIKEDSAGPPTVVVSGIGGVGKTQLVGEFAHRYGRFFAGGVYWLNLSDPASAREEVAACGGTEGMGLSDDFHALPLEERVAAVMNEWHRDLPRLIVLDDCADGPTLAGVHPSAGGCRVLATSRGPISDRALGIEAFGLEPLGRGASVELLRAYHGGAGDEKLGEIAEELGDLPLALDLAGRFLRRFRHTTDPGEYLEELRSEDVLNHPSLLDPDEREVSPTGHDMSVARTFVVSYRRLDGGDEIDRLAIRLLARAARFAPGEPIDRRLLLSAVNATEGGPAAGQLHERERALQRLVDLGLVTESEAGPVRMHKLVAASARSGVEDDGARADVERAIAHHSLEAVRTRQPVRLEPLMPHLRHAVGGAVQRGEKPAYPARFAMGHALLARGDAAEAVPHLRSSAEYNTARLRNETGLDPQERDRLFWLAMRQRNDLAAAMRRAEDFDGASGVLEPLLEDRRNHLPQPHEDVASTLLNMGATKKDQGLLHEVGPLYEEALGIREEVLERMDADDPERRQLLRDLAESHNNLGALQMDLGRPAEAAPSFRRALDIHEDLDEVEHEKYAGTSMALGAALALLGDHRNARLRLERALGACRGALREGDPRLIRPLVLLGAVLADAALDRPPGDADAGEALGAARELLEEALDLLETEHGEDHPLTAAVMALASRVAEGEGRGEDASSLCKRAEATRGAVLGWAEAESGAEFLYRWADAFGSHGLYGEGEIYGRRALEVSRSAGPDAGPDGGPPIADAEFALGRLLQLLGRNSEAERHLGEALSIRQATLGRRDPATQLVAACLAYLRGQEN